MGKPVVSSCVKSYQYVPKTRVLSITYVNNTTYDYEDVPKEVYTGFLGAESKGRYLNLNVKSNYSYTKRD